MYLQNLVLTEFRNFRSQKVELRPRLNYFVGDNGQGKTNFIEAVHLLSRGVSFRPVETTSLIRQLSVPHTNMTHESASAGSSATGYESTWELPPSYRRSRLSGLFVKDSLRFQVELTFEGSRKAASINGKRATTADLAKTFPCVLFSPESLSAIKEGPDQRRTLADELILIQNPARAHVIQEFSKALRSRNRLLRKMAAGEGDPRENDWTLQSLNSLYLMLATNLTYARIQALLAIRDEFGEAMRMISEGGIGDISVDYLISDQSALAWTEEAIFDSMRKRRQELASQEIAAGMSLVGPHKHDIRFLFAGNDSRFYCSQGQQRALILSFKIAQIVYHGRVHQTYPVLLLDDVLSELDLKKRVNLMRFLESISAQVLITATDLTWSDQFAADANSIFTVTDGCIKPFASA